MRLELQQTVNLSLDQAIEQIEALDREDATLKVQQLIRKFRIGDIVTKLEVPHGERENALQVISIKTGVHINQMREWARIYIHFGGSESKFETYLASQDKPTEYSLRDLISADTDPAVLGEQRFAKRVTNRIERLAADLEDYTTLVHKGAIDPDEADGLMFKLRDSMVEYKNLNDYKPTVPKSKDYLQEVRELPCCITGQPGPSDPHHTEVGGFRMKGTDYSCIPLSREIHRQVEDYGHEWLEKEFNVRVGNLVSRTLVMILTGHNLQLPT